MITSDTYASNIFTSHIYDREGYYRCILSNSATGVKEQLAKITLKGLIFFTIPFLCPVNNNVPDITLPKDWQEELVNALWKSITNNDKE